MNYEKSLRPFSLGKLISDPLYQVNLALWMLQPSEGAGVEPVLQKAGYKLFQIEPELSLPVELHASLQTNGTAHSQPVNPDLLICSPADEYIPLECKSKMFGSQPQPGGGDSQVKQAHSLLLLAPQILASALAFQPGGVKSSHVIYLSQHEPGVAQTKGLAEITAGLQAQGYQTAPFGLMGLGVDNNEIVLHSSSRPGSFPKTLRNQLGRSTIAVQRMTDEQTDPRPLYYLPWMPDNQSTDDAYSQQIFANRIFAAAVTQIGPRKPPCEIRLKVEDLLDAATNNLYRRWRDKPVRKQLQKRAKELLKKKLKEAEPDLEVTSLEQPEIGWKFNIQDQKIYRRIIEELRKGEYKEWNQPISQPGLFPEDDE